jgi:UrcA family protein
MNKSISIYRTLSLALAFTVVLIASNLAVAQQDVEEVIVSAPIERVKDTHTIGSIATTEVIELNRYVSYSDLDLTKVADVATLDERIAGTAKESCQALSDMFPLDRSDPAEMGRCVKKAVSGTKKRKNKAIAAAQ